MPNPGLASSSSHSNCRGRTTSSRLSPKIVATVVRKVASMVTHHEKPVFVFPTWPVLPLSRRHFCGRDSRTRGYRGVGSSHAERACGELSVSFLQARVVRCQQSSVQASWLCFRVHWE